MRKRNRYGRKGTCSKCGEPVERTDQAYCNSCHAAYMRNTRPKHSDLPEDQRRKANARAYLNAYVNKGKIKKEPCVVCGEMEKVEAHHEDYDKPLEVIWYCRKHHIELHSLNQHL